MAGSDGGHRGCALGKPKKKKKRALTEDEHRLISGAEKNQEQRSYYEMLWLTGGSQTDIALTAENIDRKTPMSPFRNSG